MLYITLVFTFLYPVFGILNSPPAETIHQRTIATGNYPNLSLTLLPPFLQVKPSGTLPLSHLLLDPETTIDCEQVKKWLKEFKSTDINLPYGNSTKAGKQFNKELSVSKGLSKPVSTKYRIDSNMILSNNPSISQLVKKINDWFIENGYPLSRVDESASFLAFSPETNSMILQIHTYEPKLSDKEPFKITFLRNEPEETAWKNDPNYFYALTPRLSSKVSDNVNYYTTVGKTDEDWLCSYLGLKRGKSLNWNPEKWKHLFESGILSEGEAILYKNADDSISVHLNLVEGQFRKIEPGFHKSLSLASDFGIKLVFQELNFDGKGKKFEVEWEQSPLFLFTRPPHLGLKCRYTSNALALLNSRLPLFEMNLFNELNAEAKENNNSTDKKSIILRGDTIFSDTLILPTEKQSPSYLGHTSRGGNFLMRGVYKFLKPLQFSYKMSLLSRQPWSNEKDNSKIKREDQIRGELTIKPLNAPKWLETFIFRSNMGILFSYKNQHDGQKTNGNNTFSLLRPITWLPSYHINKLETQNYDLLRLFNTHTLTYKLDLPIQTMPKSKDGKQPIFDMNKIHLTTHGEANIVMFPIWYLNQLTHMILDKEYIFSSNPHLWKLPPSDEVFKGGTESLRGHPNKSFGPFENSFSQTHQISIPISFQRWGVNFPFPMTLIAFMDYMTGMVAKEEELSKESKLLQDSQSYPKSIKTAKNIFSQYWGMCELQWASSLGWGCRIGRLAIDVAYPISPKLEKAKLHVYMTS